jgi:hypothetical protein
VESARPKPQPDETISLALRSGPETSYIHALLAQIRGKAMQFILAMLRDDWRREYLAVLPGEERL